MLTSEYSVLFGALSLALPTKLGQSISIEMDEGVEGLLWTALDEKDEKWLEVQFNSSLKILSSSDTEKAEFLKSLLQDAFGSRKWKGVSVQTQLEFPREWGLGSSSSLISNIAKWSKTKPLELFRKSQLGSGYDVAVAFERKALAYVLKADKGEYQAVSFQPPFSNQLYFVYLGQKQSSSKEVKRFLQEQPPSNQIIEQLSDLSLAILHCQELTHFQKLIKEHEAITGKLIGKEPIQAKLFSDFDGQIKSLGAWGGDFILAASTGNVKSYFEQKGYAPPIPFLEMIG